LPDGTVSKNIHQTSRTLMESLRVGISYPRVSILGKHALAELVAR
jgi:hypothetical protein